MNIHQCTGDLEARIPAERGVYGFVLSPLDGAQLGVPRHGGGDVDFSSVYLSIDRRLKKANRIMNRHHYKASVTEYRKIRPASLVSEIDIRTQSELYELPSYPPGNTGALRDLISLLNTFITLSALLYVGSTTTQTLRQRYSQHFSNFQSHASPDTTFGGRVAEEGISWDDLGYFSFPLPGMENKEIENIERVILSFSAPVLSRK